MIPPNPQECISSANEETAVAVVDALAPMDFDYIDTDEALAGWVQRMTLALEQHEDKRCCLDTEADSLHHYREKICLLQVACAGHFALVDPLAIQDVSPLFGLLDSSELWFHGADYDLTMLKRTYGWTPRTMRDTQIAARLVGHRHFGLAALVKEMVGLELSKASQKADWSRRPLPEVMLRYAVDDVRYLLFIADRLLAELRETGREVWFVESCAALQADVAVRLQTPREDPWRVQGSGRLQPRGLAFLREAWVWRESIAEERDLPCFRIMSNKQMLSYAEIFEKGGEVVPPAGWRPRWKKAFTEVLLEARALPASECPQRQKRPKSRFGEEERALVDRLCGLRDEVAATLNVESSLLGSRGTLEQVVASKSAEGHLMEWQKTLLAEPLSLVKGGE
jgi:ribonuclease D